MRIVLVAALVLSATFARADEPKPTARAKAIVDAQVAALTKGDETAMVATFDPEAVLLGFFSGHRVGHRSGFVQLLVGGSPHMALKKLRVVSVVAGGASGVVWWTTELEVTAFGHEPESTGPGRVTLIARMTEVASEASGWKVVAAVLDHPGKAEYREQAQSALDNTTKSGPLASLLASPAELARQFARDGSFVLGTEASERALGYTPAQKLLDSWAKLHFKIEGDVREVHGKDWGFAQANVTWDQGDKHYRMRGLVVAYDGAEANRVVAVHYTNE